MRYSRLFLLLLLYFTGRAQPSPEKDTPALVISHLSGDFYICTTYTMIDDERFPCNNMYVVTSDGIIMIDTPMDSTQFQPMLDSIRLRHHKEVVLCIATHFHSDCTGGFDFLKAKGIKTYSSKLTLELCRQRNEKQAQFYFEKDTSFTIGQYSFQTFFPGQGHSKDNIVIWFGDDRILYGGCFVKSREATNLGNLSDANVNEWSGSINRVLEKFPRQSYVIPGHQNWLGRRALQHTLYLLRKYKGMFKTT